VDGDILFDLAPDRQVMGQPFLGRRDMMVRLLEADVELMLKIGLVCDTALCIVYERVDALQVDQPLEVSIHGSRLSRRVTAMCTVPAHAAVA